MSKTPKCPKEDNPTATMTTLPKQIPSKLILSNLQTAMGGDGPEADWFAFTRNLPLYDLLNKVTARRTKLKAMSKQRIQELPAGEKEMFLSVTENEPHEDLIYEAANNQWMQTMGMHCKDGVSTLETVASFMGGLDMPQFAPDLEEMRKRCILVIHWDEAPGKVPQAQVELVIPTTAVFNGLAPQFKPVRSAEDERSEKKTPTPIPISVEKICQTSPSQIQKVKSAHISRYFDKLTALSSAPTIDDTEGTNLTKSKTKESKRSTSRKTKDLGKSLDVRISKKQIQKSPSAATPTKVQKGYDQKPLPNQRKPSKTQTAATQTKLSVPQTITTTVVNAKIPKTPPCPQNQQGATAQDSPSTKSAGKANYYSILQKARGTFSSFRRNKSGKVGDRSPKTVPSAASVKKTKK